MKLPKLSIIIPVFNVGRYLGDCIDSIISQEFQDFEIILVNDGSTDNSLDICNAYVLKDVRITVYHKENGGVSTARNLGLDYARGEWIYFVDADDSLIEGCLSCLKLSNIGVDVIQFGYNRITNSVVEQFTPFADSEYISADVFIQESSFKVLTLWIHFIRASVIKKNNILFTVGLKYAEDLEFVIKCYACASKIKTISNAGYNYYVRDDSAMTRAFTFENAKIHLAVVDNLMNFFLVNNLSLGFFLNRG